MFSYSNVFFINIHAALGHDKAQNIIDQITSAYESGGPPPGGFGFGPQHLGGPPPGFGGPPIGYGQPMPPPGFGGRKYSPLPFSAITFKPILPKRDLRFLLAQDFRP